MRFKKGHNDATRKRILEVASRQFKKDGASTGLAGIMAEAGLTNGAFYAHFESKDALFREALCEALGQQLQRLEQQPGEPSIWDGFVKGYLSEDHLLNREGGCPSAALLSEIGRQPHDTREAYEENLRGFIGTLANSLSPTTSAAQSRRAWATFSLLVGAMQMARAVADPSLSKEILSSAAEAAAALTRTDETALPESKKKKKPRSSASSSQRQ